MPETAVTAHVEDNVLALSLKINEIFYSLQGETTLMGLPTIFIRLTGCPLRCHYCDTAYAFHQGQNQRMDNILDEISQYQTSYVVVTGGEPLAQKNCATLLTLLCDKGYTVSLETSGALPIENIDSRVIKIMDIKTPDSGEENKNRYKNIECLLPNDQIKFVLCSQDDYLWSTDIIKQYQLANRCEVLLSPSQQQLSATDLANWILEDQLPVRMQIQLHKLLWGDTPGR